MVEANLRRTETMFRATAERDQDIRAALAAVATLAKLIALQGKFVPEVRQAEAERKAASAETSAEEHHAFQSRCMRELRRIRKLSRGSSGSFVRNSWRRMIAFETAFIVGD